MVTTRTQSYTPPPHPQDPLTHRLTTYALHLSTSSLAPLIYSLINHSLPRHAPHPLFRPQNRAHLLRESLLILCSTSPVLHAAVAGTLTAQLLTRTPTPADLALRRDYAVLQERAAAGQPCIYVHVLADETGCAPSPEDMLVLAEGLARYTAPATTADQGLVERVDALGPPPPPPSAGRRHDGGRVGKYLLTARGSTGHASSSRVSAVRSLVSGIRARFASLPASQRSVPLAHPPAEAGYTARAPTRILQHRARQSSNPVMNLVEDMCAVLHSHPRHALRRRYTMHAHILLLLTRPPPQASLAEILVSTLMGAWTEDGGGFNAYAAGRSVESAARVSAERWEKYAVWADAEMGVRERMREQRSSGLGLDIEVWDEGWEKAWWEAVGGSEEFGGDEEEDGEID